MLELPTGLGIKEIRGNKDYIGFKLSDDSEHVFNTEGDCCASCWIEHLSGVPLALQGGNITKIEEHDQKEIPNKDPKDTWNVTNSYRTSIITDKGQLDIEYRTYHNGYYGGRLRKSTEKYNTLPIITEDF